MASLNLDPEIAAVLDLLAPITLGDESLVEMRSLMAGLGGGAALPPGVVVDEHVVNDDGVIVRILRPAAATPAAPCLYWIHGGGFVMGDRAVDDVQLGGWVAEIGCVVVSVEYRLAPEHPYPLPLDDCYAGLAWVHDNAALLGIDLTQLATASLAAKRGEPVSTGIGALIALACVAAIAATFGRQLIARIPIHRINYIGATVFAALAVWTLVELI